MVKVGFPSDQPHGLLQDILKPPPRHFKASSKAFRGLLQDIWKPRGLLQDISKHRGLLQDISKPQGLLQYISRPRVLLQNISHSAPATIHREISTSLELIFSP